MVNIIAFIARIHPITHGNKYGNCLNIPYGSTDSDFLCSSFSSNSYDITNNPPIYNHVKSVFIMSECLIK